MAVKGYIALHRKLLDNPIICKDSDYLAVWIFLLLNATHTEYEELFEGERITLKKGQLITGRKSISQKLLVDENKVTRILKSFENEQQIEQQTSNKNRLITVLKWSEYQNVKQQNEQQVNNNRTTSEQQVNTYNNGNKNNNGKNVKNKDKEVGRFTPPSLIELTDFITSNNYFINAQRFMDFYESKGWMIGKNKMKDWKATVRGWQSRDKQTPQKTSSFLDMLKEEENESN